MIVVDYDTAICENCGLYIENPYCNEGQYFCNCKVCK